MLFVVPTPAGAGRNAPQSQDRWRWGWARSDRSVVPFFAFSGGWDGAFHRTGRVRVVGSKVPSQERVLGA